MWVHVRYVLPLTCSLLVACVSVPPDMRSTNAFAHGVAAGLAENGEAVIWTRGSRSGILRLSLSEWTGSGGFREVRSGEMEIGPETDLTAKWVLSELRAGTLHRYRIERTDRQGKAATGQFESPPSAHTPQAVTVAWGADVAGQNICRHPQEGFPIFAAIKKSAPNIFIGAGDMIYADGHCRAINRYGDPQVPGPRRKAANLDGFREHWRYVRNDPGLRDLLSTTAYLPVWDDHEVVNNFGPLHDTRDRPPYAANVHLLPLGLAAFFEYNPVVAPTNTPNRLYRKLRWGRHLELFLLDTRQYRDHNYSVDSKEKPKTMLGHAQLAWLKDGLTMSDATWKVVVSTVPLSVPTAFTPGRQPDAWANGDRSGGFEWELRDIVEHAHRTGVRNFLWLTGDVHMGAVFRYRPIEDDPGFVFYEAISGPLHARVFGSTKMDATLRPERLYLHAPRNFRDIKTYEQVKQWWNYGLLQIDAAGALELSLRNVNAEPVYSFSLAPK